MIHSNNSRENRLAAINVHLRTIGNCLREISTLLEGLVEDEVDEDED